jgi:hypothetical protein
MPTAKGVKLNISATSKNGNNWQSTPATNGATYWYRFQGGNKTADNGDQDCGVGGPAETFTITFQGGDKDSYDFVEFYKDPATDPHNQLSGSVSTDKKTVTVTDTCTTACDGMVYGAVVCPVSESTTKFTCHPVISNKQLLE